MTGNVQTVPPQPLRQHLLLPSHWLSEKHVISQIPIATGGGHAPGLGFCWATIEEIVKSRSAIAKMTLPIIVNTCLSLPACEASVWLKTGSPCKLGIHDVPNADANALVWSECSNRITLNNFFFKEWSGGIQFDKLTYKHRWGNTQPPIANYA